MIAVCLAQDAVLNYSDPCLPGSGYGSQIRDSCYAAQDTVVNYNDSRLPGSGYGNKLLCFLFAWLRIR